MLPIEDALRKLQAAIVEYDEFLTLIKNFATSEDNSWYIERKKKKEEKTVLRNGQDGLLAELGQLKTGLRPDFISP